MGRTIWSCAPLIKTTVQWSANILCRLRLQLREHILPGDILVLFSPRLTNHIAYPGGEGTQDSPAVHIHYGSVLWSCSRCRKDPCLETRRRSHGAGRQGRKCQCTTNIFGFVFDNGTRSSTTTTRSITPPTEKKPAKASWSHGRISFANNLPFMETEDNSHCVNIHTNICQGKSNESIMLDRIIIFLRLNDEVVLCR